MLSLMIFRYERSPLPSGVVSPILISTKFFDLPCNFFQRSTMKDVLTFISREVVKRTPINERVRTSHEKLGAHGETPPYGGGYLAYGKASPVGRHVCNSFVGEDGIGGVVVSNIDYPAFTMIDNAIRLLKVQYPNIYDKCNKDV